MAWNSQIRNQNRPSFSFASCRATDMQLIILYTGATTTHSDMMFTTRKECEQINFVIVLKFFPKSLFCCYDSALLFFGLGLVSVYLS